MLTSMTKKEAAEIFGGKWVDLAAGVGLTKQAINAWPDTLRQEHIDRVIGAAIRLGRPIPGIENLSNNEKAA